MRFVPIAPHTYLLPLPLVRLDVSASAFRRNRLVCGTCFLTPFDFPQRVEKLRSANSRNQTTLMIAVQTGREEIVKAVVGFIGEGWVPADDQVCVHSLQSVCPVWSNLARLLRPNSCYSYTWTRMSFCQRCRNSLKRSLSVWIESSGFFVMVSVSPQKIT